MSTAAARQGSWIHPGADAGPDLAGPKAAVPSAPKGTAVARAHLTLHPDGLDGPTDSDPTPLHWAATARLRVRPRAGVIALATLSPTVTLYPFGVTRGEWGTGKVMETEAKTPREAEMSALEYEIRVSGLVPDS